MFRATTRKRKLAAAFAAVAIEVGVVWAFVSGLATRWVKSVAPAHLTVTEFAPEALPPSPPPKPVARPEGAAAPAGPKAQREPALAPRIALATPSPAPTAAGQAVIGAGSGAGSTGSGNGAGGAGSGAGGGLASGPQRVAGTLSDRDYPRGAGRPSGTVGIAFRVRSDGAVDQCRVIATSGSSQLDGLTCSLVQQRFRYRPALDPAGRPVDSALRASFTYGVR